MHSKRVFCFFAAFCCALLISFTDQLQTVELSLKGSETSNAERLSVLFEDFFEEMQETSPEFATFIGLTTAYNQMWTDHSESGYLSRHLLANNKLAELHTLDREALSASGKLNYDLFEKDLKDELEGSIYETWYMPLNQLGGIPLTVESVLMMMPTSTETDYEHILSRLIKIPLLIDQTIRLMEIGLEKGITPPQIALQSLPSCISGMIPPSFETSIFFQPFKNFPPSMTQEKQDLLAERASGIILQAVYPAYKKLSDYLKDTYIPSCRLTIGAGDMPNGENYYRYCAKKHTTTSLSPLEIHHIGLNEVARIHADMQAIIDGIGFSGSIADYFHYLNTSSEFFYTEPESLIEGYRAITRFIDGQLPLLFGRLPKLPYEVLPVPAFSEAGQVGAYYVSGSLTTGRPGRFFANTYDMASRPKWQMESLALHEAVPGHHFQISLAQEIEGLPEFRKYNGYTAYIEGWGLYAESLGEELGLYRTPPDQFGRLIEEVWRAVRLVVDTGIHAFGWSRDEAIAYMQEKTGMGKREVATEIDRYIVWPGQALAYKIGELSIKKWRREAQKALGDSFDIRAFHDMLLEQGALPLDICERQVHAWLVH